MRVLVLGQTGVEKRRFLTSLVAHARKERNLPVADEDPYADRFVRAYHLEEEIQKHTGNQTIQPFLDLVSSPGRVSTWQDVMEKRILRHLSDNPAEHIFLSLHGFFYRHNHFFTPIDWPLLKKFEPNLVLTLIDDVYDVAARVTKVREVAGPKTQSKITAGEALIWRSVETCAADLIARSLGIPHFVLSVKHPVQTAYRLIFAREVKRIYASYPISSTRKISKRVNEVNAHRAEIHKSYAVFDPVCIDEYRAVPPKKKGDEWTHLDRWPLAPVTPVVASNRDFAKSMWKELERMEPVIAGQLEERDYRMVDQAEIVVAYRPFWGGVKYPAQGVEKEILHAINTNKTVYYFDPPEDRKTRKKQLFTAIERGIKFDSKEDLYDALEKVQPRRA